MNKVVVMMNIKAELLTVGQKLGKDARCCNEQVNRCNLEPPQDALKPSWRIITKPIKIIRILKC